MNLFSFPSILYWTEVVCRYKSFFPLFTIIMNSLVLYQKFLNERRRTIYILLSFVYSNFVALPFAWSALFCLKISLFISISKVYLICSKTSLLADFFSVNFSKEITKIFSGSSRTSANNSRSFSIYRLAFFVVLPFLSALCDNKNRFFSTAVVS